MMTAYARVSEHQCWGMLGALVLQSLTKGHGTAWRAQQESLSLLREPGRAGAAA